MIDTFSELQLTLSDGGTVPSLDYLSIKTFVNIGSGNILKMSWNTPAATNNIVDNYKVYLLAYDNKTAEYKLVYNENIGRVNTFYLKASMLKNISQSLVPVRLYVEAVSKFGSEYNRISNIESIWITKGSGAYIKVETGYPQPIMKRALAFSNLDYLPLTAEDGKVLKASSGEILYGKRSSVQDDENGWTLMQECFIPGSAEDVLMDALGRVLTDSNDKVLYAAGTGWQRSDIKYEVLMDANGGILTDKDNNPIYVL